MAHGAFSWNELLTNDVDKAKQFYTATLGWSFQPMNMTEHTYWVAQQDGKPVGGMLDMKGITPPGVNPHWFGYVEVDDVDKRVEMVAKSGGKVMREPFDIPDVGRIAIIVDPTGAPLGWMTPEQRG